MMYKIDKLTIMTGLDILIPNTSVKVHQPTINEIALIGEEKLFSSLSLFMINTEDFKANLLKVSNIESDAEKDLIKNLNDYSILLFLLNSDIEARNNGREGSSTEEFCKLIFNLLFVDYDFIFSQTTFKIHLIDKKEGTILDFNSELFMILKDIVSQIFLFNKFFGENKYNPVNSKAEEIANKMKKSQGKIDAQKGTQQNSLFSNMISILGATGHDIVSLNKLTICQLYNLFERFSLYMQYDQSIKAALAGSTKVDIVDWFQQI